MAIISATIFTRVDQAGVPRTEAWLTIELSGGYADGGMGQDLSPYFRRLESVLTQPVSGSTLRAPASGAGLLSGLAFQSGCRVDFMPVIQDYAAPVSTRFQVLGVPAGLTSGGPSQIGKYEVGSGALAAAISGIRFLAHVIGH